MKFRILYTGLFFLICLSSRAQADCNGTSPSDLMIPNVITPNSDGKNDEFKVVSTDISSLHVEIFNRWGMKVYAYDGVNGIWDATVFGSIQASGIYFYNVEYVSSCAPGVPIKAGGYFTLLRPN